MPSWMAVLSILIFCWRDVGDDSRAALCHVWWKCSLLCDKQCGSKPSCPLIVPNQTMDGKRRGGRLGPHETMLEWFILHMHSAIGQDGRRPY